MDIRWYVAGDCWGHCRMVVLVNLGRGWTSPHAGMVGWWCSTSNENVVVLRRCNTPMYIVGTWCDAGYLGRPDGGAIECVKRWDIIAGGERC
jgi:hypothetical protein